MYIEPLKIRPNAQGKMSVACPRCRHEFKVSLESIRRGETIICPVSKDRFQFSEKCLSREDNARAEKILSDWFNRNKPTIRIEL